jgi:FtsZ-binding cell division protein ZapB
LLPNNRNSNNVQEIVADIREDLNLTEDWANQYNNWQEALESLIHHIEDLAFFPYSMG